MKTRYTLTAVFTAWLAYGATAAPAADDGFTAYWVRFRAAALRDDMATLATLTRFPLEAGFDSDQDNPRRITPAQFPALIRTELRCDALSEGTTREMFARRTVLDPKYDYHVDGRAVIDRFGFDRIAGRWRLTLLSYGDISDFKSRLKGSCQ